MPSNVEIKARVLDPNRQRILIEQLTAEPPIVLRQKDTFFMCRRGWS